MAITVKPGFAHRFGHAVGAGVGRFLALEPRLAYTFRRRGLPPVLVKILFWSVKLAMIAVLLYVAFWVAIFVAGLFILVAIGENMRKSDSDSGAGFSFVGTVAENMNGTENLDPNDPGYHEREAWGVLRSK